MKLRKYLNESSTTKMSFWISPNGEIYGSMRSHIDVVIGNPDKFGLKFEDIEKLYQSYNEPMGHEGKAREEIIKRLMRKGWIRIRKYRNFYSVSIFHEKVTKLDYLDEWAYTLLNKGINGLREKDRYFPVIITSLGNYRKETTMGELASNGIVENTSIVDTPDKLSYIGMYENFWEGNPVNECLTME